MNQELNITGFDLYEISNDVWALEIKNSHTYSGTFLEVAVYAVSRYNFNPDEIDIAVQAMVQHGYNAAHFGIGRIFMYPFNKEVHNDKKAS